MLWIELAVSKQMGYLKKGNHDFKIRYIKVGNENIQNFKSTPATVGGGVRWALESDLLLFESQVLNTSLTLTPTWPIAETWMIFTAISSTRSSYLWLEFKEPLFCPSLSTLLPIQESTIYIYMLIEIFIEIHSNWNIKNSVFILHLNHTSPSHFKKARNDLPPWE